MTLALVSGILFSPALHAQPQPGLGENPPGMNSDEGAGMTETDPLAAFNTKMFWFNRKLDDYFLHPVATGYAKVVPESARRSVGRFIDNVSVIPRFANNLFQLRLQQAGTEVTRFGINTTVGLAGLFDPADQWFGLKENRDDFGLTLGRYSVPTGPYLVLPFFGPSTIRDAVGRVADAAMNPMSYLLPWYITTPTTAGEYLADAINYRSLNPDLFEDVDRFSIDVYGAVQDGYTQRRAAAQKTVNRDSLFPKSQTP